MTTDISTPTSKDLKSVYKVGAIAVLIQLATILLILVASFALGLGPRPTTVPEFYAMYTESKFTGILRDDFSSLILIAMYLGSAPALFFALRKQNFTVALIVNHHDAGRRRGCLCRTCRLFDDAPLSDLYATAAQKPSAHNCWPPARPSWPAICGTAPPVTWRHSPARARRDPLFPHAAQQRFQ